MNTPNQSEKDTLSTAPKVESILGTSVHRNILVLPVVPSTCFLLQRLNDCLHQGYFDATENYDASTSEDYFGHFVVGQLMITV